MPKRINLTISDELFKKIEQDANRFDVTVTMMIESTLEDKYDVNIFNYPASLALLVQEALNLPPNKIFTVSQIPCFDMVVENAKNYGLTEQQIKARMGKYFNQKIREKSFKGIKRATDNFGRPKTICRAAAYIREEN